jgi:hypothetical protein
VVVAVGKKPIARSKVSMPDPILEKKKEPKKELNSPCPTVDGP